MKQEQDKLDDNRGEVVSVTIRFPVEVHRRVKALAENERRSLNSQVVRMLERILDGYKW